MNSSEILVERPHAWGVTRPGLPGDGINGVMEALREAHEQNHSIHVRHEESAAFTPSRVHRSFRLKLRRSGRPDPIW